MQIVTRSRRRMESRKKLFPLLFFLAVALIGFALGVMVGRGQSRKSSGSPPAAAVPPSPAAQPSAAAPAAKELTFYDTLPRGEQAPLGSGINLPREAPAPVDQPTAALSPVTPAPETTATQPAPVASAAPTGPVAGREAGAKDPLPAATAGTSPASVGAPAGKGNWVIQVASYKTAEDARKMRERLAGKGFRTAVREADLKEKGKWYRVVVGPYPSDGEAGRAAGRLQNEAKVSGLVRKE